MANKTLLISPQVVEQYATFTKGLDANYVRPFIETAQDIRVQEVLGSKLLRRLQQMIDTNTLNDDYRELLEEHITPMLVWETLAQMVIPTTYKLRNAGVVQNYGEHIQTTTMSDANALKNDYETKSNFYQSRLLAFLHANHNRYPEFCKTDTCADMHSKENYHIPLA